jgi:hypothetical protein
MPGLKARWRAIIGSVILAVGLYLSFIGQTRFYPGLVLVVGSVCWIVFLILNDPSWSNHEVRRDPDGPAPLGSTPKSPGPES